ncbi:hypothetical protein GS597_01535 [Synechococcales cyanobacterium C]|uniref:Uncharacterized protein n=1 Tax=Petrachloros mirabilis ULC683 TaxID=2781853 RepID=A0A8K2ABU9_9CYAN|nr:hypothetical protein [Petrachloros mirabilis]NCJ05220.1 hypothetical protein [Petrachloros mirabilis ULC683]
MTLEPKIMQAVEQLNYRVTVGDVATHTGLEVNFTQQGLLALASNANGNLQVSESGEVVYLFPPSFRAILRNKFLRLRLQEGWEKVWRILFYLIRISFGVFLLVSIVLIVLAITLILMSGNRNSSGRGRSSYGSSGLLQSLMIRNAFFYFFAGNPYGSRGRRRPPPRNTTGGEEMNFFEAIFSFLFGDGNPNANLEDRRWALIGTVIRNHRGAVAAEQIAPYLDLPEDNPEDEDYMLPVLVRFQGQPEVSPQGHIIYQFPQLQTTAADTPQQSVPAALVEQPWKFSQASSSQVLMAIGLGAVNLVGALVLQGLLADGAVAQELGGLVAFVQSIFWLLLAYGIGFLGVPLIRYYWIQRQNHRIEQRNQQRQTYVLRLKQSDESLQQKLRYAQQFANQSVITSDNLTYTTEKSLLEQEAERQDAIDTEWQRRLNQE